LNKVVFLDRDGTINVDYGYVHTKEKFELINGAIEGLKIFQKMDYKLIIITNQSGIGRGYFTEAEYLEFQNCIDDILKSNGVEITAYYYCPHDSDSKCNCRKPNIGLFEQAGVDFDIDWGKSIVIGDRYRDLAVCEAKGVKGFFIRGTEAEKEIAGISSVDSLLNAALITKNQYK
jgi:D-glycero-D-manno-heptose 1,7-bisphosphate phosphatase